MRTRLQPDSAKPAAIRIIHDPGRKKATASTVRYVNPIVPNSRFIVFLRVGSIVVHSVAKRHQPVAEVNIFNHSVAVACGNVIVTEIPKASDAE